MHFQILPTAQPPPGWFIPIVQPFPSPDNYTSAPLLFHSPVDTLQPLSVTPFTPCGIIQSPRPASPISRDPLLLTCTISSSSSHAG